MIKLMITFQISDKVFQNNPELQELFCTQKNTFKQVKAPYKK